MSSLNSSFSSSSSSSSSTAMKPNNTTTTNSSCSTTPCRRDTNCTCKICQASFISTLDLLPLSAHRPTRPTPASPPQTPLSFNPSTISTPQSTITPHRRPFVPDSTNLQLKIKKKNKNRCFSGTMRMIECLLVVLCLGLVLKSGFSFFRCGRTILSPEIVRNISEKALGFRDVEEKLGFLNQELQNVVGGSFGVANNWETVQDGLILRSRCQLYKSGMEEVSIWGWPLQTSGLLTTDFASRSFTVLSGSVTEWSNGELSGSIRKPNTSWEQGKWSTLVWRLDENTWILEYKRSFVSFSSAIELLKFKMMRSFEWMNQLWKVTAVNQLPPT